MPFKRSGNPVYIIGETLSELGGSHYAKLAGAKGGKAPKVNFKNAGRIFSKLGALLAKQRPESRTVAACHDCSEGGIGVALAEMAFAGGLGAQIELGKMPMGEKIRRDDFILFSESNTRFIVEVEAERRKEFEGAMKGTAFAEIGRVAGNTLEIKGLAGNIIVNEGIDALKRAWKGTLWW